MFTLLTGTDLCWKFKVRSINVHKSNKGASVDFVYIRPCENNWADISSQVDKHPGAIDSDRDAIYLDPNYRLIN